MELALKEPKRVARRAKKWASEPESVELAIAVLSGRVSYRQAAKALGMGGEAGVRYWCVTVLREAHFDGKIDLCKLLPTKPQA